MVFHPDFNHPLQYFITKLLARESWVLAKWMNSSIIHHNICSLIHEKCHPKSCHSDMKYHMTVNIIFRAISPFYCHFAQLLEPHGHDIFIFAQVFRIFVMFLTWQTSTNAVDVGDWGRRVTSVKSDGRESTCNVASPEARSCFHRP